MHLHTLLRQFDAQLSLHGVPNAEVRSVRDDSRLVCAGDVFVARTTTV